MMVTPALLMMFVQEGRVNRVLHGFVMIAMPVLMMLAIL
jgi:hypothetical protein